MSRKNKLTRYESLIPSESLMRKRMDAWDAFMRKYDREETPEQLANAINISELGENMSDDETVEFGTDSDNNFEDSNAEEAARNEPELDPKKVLRILQPIINKRIRCYETVREQQSMKTIRTKDKIVEIADSAKESKKFSDEQTKTILDGCSPTVTNALVSSSTMVDVTPIRKLPVKGKYGQVEEIEEVVTTTTVTTTTKKLRRTTTLVRNDANTAHAKRKLDMQSIDEDEENMGEFVSRPSKRHTFHALTEKTSRRDNVLMQQSMNETGREIAIYTPKDAAKYTTKDATKVQFEPEDLNRAVFDKTHIDSTAIDSSIKINRNDSLMYKPGTVDAVQFGQVVKAKSKVDILARMSGASLQQLFISYNNQN